MLIAHLSNIRAGRYMWVLGTVNEGNFEFGREDRCRYMNCLKNRRGLIFEVSEPGPKRFMLEIIFVFQKNFFRGGSPFTLYDFLQFKTILSKFF